MSDNEQNVLTVKNHPTEAATAQAVEKSIEGKYFVGQTKYVVFGNGMNAWGGLINPDGSGVNLLVSTFTITNITGIPYVAQVRFNSEPGSTASISDQVICANTAMVPLPAPKVRVQYEQLTSGFLPGGVDAFEVLVPAYSTMVNNKDGKFIIPPGGSFIVFLVSPGSEMVKAKLAFGWWEE